LRERIFFNWFIDATKAGEIDQEVVVYGFEQGIIALFGIMIALLMGAIFGIFLQGCIFMLAFIPLRMYAGGYHASTRRRCAVISFILLFICFSGIKFWNISGFNTLILGGIESLLLFFLIPVDGTYALEPLEKVVYKNRGRKIILIETIFLVGMSILRYNFIAESIVAVLSLVLALLLLGKMKNRYSRR